MTEKQAERIKLKIKKIKADLAADKKRWGGFYDDSRGLRYLPPQLYIKLGDYKGGLRYINWFNKNFPDDIGFPDFLLENTIILFYSKKYAAAEKMAFKTYCRNTYLFDKFLGNPIVPVDKYEGSNLEVPEYVDGLNYSSEQEHLSEFSAWLQTVIQSARFKDAREGYINCHKQLKGEDKLEKRRELITEANRIKETF